MKLEPYLFFDGRCEEALDFYREAVGAQVTALMRFSESPDPLPPEMQRPGLDQKVMHASVQLGDSRFMASDGKAQNQPAFAGFALSLEVADDAEARRVFDALSHGGQVQMPLGKTFWASSFGMLTDRFGVAWMVMTSAS